MGANLTLYLSKDECIYRRFSGAPRYFLLDAIAKKGSPNAATPGPLYMTIEVVNVAVLQGLVVF